MNDEPQITLLAYLNHIALESRTSTGKAVAKDGLQPVFLGIISNIIHMDVHVDAIVSIEFTPDGPFVDWKTGTAEEWRDYMSHMAQHAKLSAAADAISKALGTDE